MKIKTFYKLNQDYTNGLVGHSLSWTNMKELQLSPKKTFKSKLWKINEIIIESFNNTEDDFEQTSASKDYSSIPKIFDKSLETLDKVIINDTICEKNSKNPSVINSSVTYEFVDVNKTKKDLKDNLSEFEENQRHLIANLKEKYPSSNRCNKALQSLNANSPYFENNLFSDNSQFDSYQNRFSVQFKPQLDSNSSNFTILQEPSNGNGDQLNYTAANEFQNLSKFDEFENYNKHANQHCFNFQFQNNNLETINPTHENNINNQLHNYYNSNLIRLNTLESFLYNQKNQTDKNSSEIITGNKSIEENDFREPFNEFTKYGYPTSSDKKYSNFFQNPDQNYYVTNDSKTLTSIFTNSDNSFKNYQMQLYETQNIEEFYSLNTLNTNIINEDFSASNFLLKDQYQNSLLKKN
jgi:hypothetical protein